MKGCLKQPSRASSPTTDLPPSRKHVVFDEDGSEQVFFADEWDRTPAEPARNLSYQDILELKEIQRSLPRAVQPADLIGNRPASHYLSTVPIGLLPLLPETNNTPPPASNLASTLTFSQNSWRTVRTPAPSIPTPQTSTWHPPHLSHLPPARPPLNRQKGRFAFLPLLEPNGSRSRSPSPPCSPPPSDRSISPDFLPSDSDVSHDPPTPSLTNASLDSSPLSRASSCSPEPPFFQLPPSKQGRWGDEFKNSGAGFPMYTDADHLTSEALIHDPYDYRRPGYGASNKAAALPIPIPNHPTTPSTPQKRKPKKKNVIVINDIEIELDDDDNDNGADEDEDEEESNTPPAKSMPSRPQVASPTPTRPTTSSSPAFSLHAPICFKRTAISASPPSNKTTCSPPRSVPVGTGGCSGRLLVPSV